MREDQSVSSARKAALRMALLNASAGASRVPALLPGIGLIKNQFRQATIDSNQDKDMAGGTPANPATLVLTK
jgi:hypothetical protein